MSTITIWLLMDRLKLSDVLVGVIWTLWGCIVLILVGNWIYKVFWSEAADPQYEVKS